MKIKRILILAIVFFLTLMSPIQACTLSRHTLYIQNILSENELTDLLGKCLDSKCKLQLSRNISQEFVISIFSEQAAETTFSNMEDSVNLVFANTIQFFNSDLDLKTIDLEALFEAHDKLSLFNLSDNKELIISLLRETIESSKVLPPAGMSLEILKNIDPTLEKEVKDQYKDIFRCKDSQLIKGENYYIHIERDRGFMQVLPRFSMQCEHYEF